MRFQKASDQQNLKGPRLQCSLRRTATQALCNPETCPQAARISGRKVLRRTAFLRATTQALCNPEACAQVARISGRKVLIPLRRRRRTGGRSESQDVPSLLHVSPAMPPRPAGRMSIVAPATCHGSHSRTLHDRRAARPKDQALRPSAASPPHDQPQHAEPDQPHGHQLGGPGSAWNGTPR